MFRSVPALLEWPRRALRGRPRLRPRSRLATRLILIVSFLGPGLIAANAGNDAGGIATYASVGAKYGYDLLWMMVLITISLIVVQEMAARMGVVTGKGLAELVREQYGVRWATFSMVSVLIANLGICISEFVGIGAALGLAHIPKYASVPVAAIVVWLLLVRGSYKVAERIFVLMTIPFFAYPIAAILAKPKWSDVGHAVVAPHFQLNSGYLFLFIATAGTTITPFMQLYVQSAVVERGIDTDELNAERAEVTSGSKFPVDFYFTLVGGAKTWQKTHKSVTVMYGQGKAATDDAGEIAAIQDMVAAGVKGIAITPTSAAVIPALNKAVKAGVKVVLMDNDLPTWKKKSSVVATNNLKGGTLAGKFLAGKLKAGDSLGILEGVPGVPALDDRVSGMLQGLGTLKDQIKIVSKLETDCDQTKGAAAAQTMLTANPSLTAIYSACGPPALGAIQSIKNAGAKGIILVGFDGSPGEVSAIKAGTETASVAQHPAKIGSLGIATLYAAVQGKKVAKNVDTGTSLITVGNAK